MLPPFERAFEPTQHRPAEEPAMAVERLPPHVHECDGRQRLAMDPVRQHHLGTAARAARMPRLERGRGRPQHQARAGPGGEHLGGRPGVVARVLILLVGPVMFLVEDDEARVGQGGEQRAAGSHDDARLAPGRAQPTLEALAFREARVKRPARRSAAGSVPRSGA